MTHEEMFEAFYSVVLKGTGKECANFFNNQLEKAKGNEEDLRFLLNSLRCHHHKGLVFEEADIFKTFENIIREEIKKELDCSLDEALKIAESEGINVQIKNI